MSKAWYQEAGWLVGLAALAGVAASVILDVQAAREEASQWQKTDRRMLRWLELSEEEWHQYQARSTLIGKPLAEMTPYEVLGIYADDPEQRRRFARENARFMLDFYRRTMEFEQIYREELAKLSGEKRP